LVNARHLKRVPGRKTDIRDCQWIAQLLQHGLLKGSFIPPRPQHELRDLTRHRTQLVEEKDAHRQSDSKGTGRRQHQAGGGGAGHYGRLGPVHAASPDRGWGRSVKLADLAQQRLRGKIPESERALHGHVTEHHRFLLRLLGKELSQKEVLIAALEAKIEEATRLFAAEIERLDAVPGVDRRVAEVVLAEVGADLTLSPRIGMWPLGRGWVRAMKRVPGNIGGNASRRAIAGWNAALCKRPGQRATQARAIWHPSTGASRGAAARKRALIAVRHSILVISYHLVKEGTTYADLGGDFFDRLEPERLTRYYVKRLERLGHTVTLESRATV
jgi:transposase